MSFLNRAGALSAFDINRRVSREQIISICEAGRWAPSCFGDEPWRYLVWDKYHDEDAYNRAFGCLVEWNQRWVKTAPVLMASIADNQFRKNGDANRWAQHDTGAASENICLQATALGLKAHQMGGYDAEKLKKEFNIPERFTPMAMIAIGYQAEESVLDEDHRKEEQKDRFRRPLGITFFDSQWEKPITGDIA
jgi:nitroreductase